MLPAWFLMMLPQLIGGLGQLIGSSAAVQRQNRYNSPFEQLKRLKHAGLPFAAYGEGNAGQQSSLPDMSGWGTIGNAVGTGVTQANQISMFRELLRKAGYDADIRGNDKSISDEDTAEMLSTRDGAYGTMTNARYMKKLEVEMKEQGFWIQRFQQEMVEVDRLIKGSRFENGQLMKQAEAEFDKLILSNKLANQVWDNNDARQKAFQKIVDTMEGSDGRLSFINALLIQLAGSLGGGVSGGGMNLGF